MDWYYADGTNQVGPLDGRQMGQLAQQGKVTPETLVWRAGFPAWVAAKKAAPHLFLGVAPQPAPPQAAAPKPGEGTPGAGRAPAPSLNLQSNLVDALADTGGAPNLLNDLADFSGLSGLGVLGEAMSPVVADPVVGEEFFCAACGTMKPSSQAATFEGKVLCLQCGRKLGKEEGLAYAEGEAFYREKAKRRPFRRLLAFYGRNRLQFIFAGAALGLLLVIMLLRLARAFEPAGLLAFVLAAAVLGTAYTGNGLGRAYGRTVVLATIFALVGELFLFQGSGLLLIGALSFLAAHGAFLIAFWIRGFSLGWSMGTALPLLAISGASYFWLHTDASVEMEIALIGFGLVLTTMTVFGIATVGADSGYLILLGAIGFYVSDLLFARALVFDLRAGLGDTLCALPFRHVALLLFAFSISAEREQGIRLEEQRQAAAARAPQPYDPLIHF
ncbi:MAG TPA: lysoplasmalogenase family protein [Candidatus Hydrogenedentes bacterium]|jgi:hypothetical protein|nr:lysoplasmalogenase family protein [Candidatus Hydrogenedentota bacterium]HPJ98045.1 lysoplasmalogenase family protein [Candidatus Hydrogenedentota bacterium]